MTEIAMKSLSGSMGNSSSLVARSMAGHLFLNPMSFSVEEYERHPPFVNYTLSPSTYGEYAALFAASRLAAISSARLETFYADLMAKQERLGKELEQVLF